MAENCRKDVRSIQKNFRFLDGLMVYYKGYEKTSFKKRLSVAIEEGRLIRSLINFVRFDLFVPYFKYYLIKFNCLTSNQYFIVSGKKYKYCIKRHNSVDNERVIEVPYSIAFVLNNKDKSRNLLEVGRVLSNYTNIRHDVVDKYETGHGIINRDIVNYNTKKRYDLIVAISTVEHIGYDEQKKTKDKALKAILNMIKLLKKDGELLITVPLNYNPEIDDILIHRKIKFSEKHFMKRVSWLNMWEETDQEDAFKYKYNGKYSAANAVAFLIYKK